MYLIKCVYIQIFCSTICNIIFDTYVQTVILQIVLNMFFQSAIIWNFQNRDQLARRRNTLTGGELNSDTQSSKAQSRRHSLFKASHGMAEFRKKMRSFEPTFKLEPDDQPNLASVKLVIYETLQSKLWF